MESKETTEENNQILSHRNINVEELGEDMDTVNDSNLLTNDETEKRSQILKKVNFLFF